MMSRQQMFAAGKGDLGRTNIVQHQINTGDHPPIKQLVRRYMAAQEEEEPKLVQGMLEIGIIQDSSSAWSSLTVLGRDDAVLYRLPTTKPGHQGGCLSSWIGGGGYTNSEGNDVGRADPELRADYRTYPGKTEGRSPGPPSTIRLPHTKGETPDKDLTPTESEQDDSERGGPLEVLQ